MKEKVVIFGAGQFGRQALSEYKDRTLFIIDNNVALWGTQLEGIEIKPVETLTIDADYTVLIASRNFELMEKQLQGLGISDYEYFTDDPRAYYSTKELIFNPYQENKLRDLSEQEKIEADKQNSAIQAVNQRVAELQGKDTMFDHVEIETINRCNGGCEFCPVSVNNETREYKEMPWTLFQKIIDELATLNYAGRLACFSNNEPFLDSTITAKLKYAREKIPRARMHLFTNGTLLNIEKFLEAVKYLDELVIDNYNQELELIKPCKEIAAYCEEHPELKKKVTIVLRKPREILSTRGGDAPNRKEIVSYGNERCILPYKQMIIRPDGKVSLCCNDARGKFTLGDVSKDSLTDVWNSARFKMIRKCLYEGRKNWGNCEYCDVFKLD